MSTESRTAPRIALRHARIATGIVEGKSLAGIAREEGVSRQTKTWFPDMVAELRKRWRAGLSFAEIVDLRDEFDAMVHQIRSTRHIRTPVTRCPKCGHVGPAAEPDVSVRSMIIALAKFGITSPEEAKTLEKRWAAYRRTNGLDLHGKAAGSVNNMKPSCGHESDARR